MKIAFIPPVKYLHEFGNVTDYHMALAHLVEKNLDYRKFYEDRSARGEHVILDNSIIELGDAVSLDRLLRAANNIGAKEIVIPDVLDSAIQTAQNADRFAQKIKEAGFKTIAVVQGKDMKDVLACYRRFLDHQYVDVIAFPKRLNLLFPNANMMGRYQAVANCFAHTIGMRIKPIHLLGIWGNPMEIFFYGGIKQVRGIDSQIPFTAANANVRFDLNEGLLKELPNDKRIKLDDKELELPIDITTHNMLAMLRWANNDTVYGL